MALANIHLAAVLISLQGILLVSSGDLLDLSRNTSEIDLNGWERSVRLLDNDNFEIKLRMNNGITLGCQGQKRDESDEILELFMEDELGRREPVGLEISPAKYRSETGSLEDMNVSLKWWPRDCVEKLAGFYRDDLTCDCQPGQPGSDGLPGIDGPPGPQGPNGKPGRDGKNGQNGVDGLKGAPGKPGAKGPPGAPGQIGSPGGIGVIGDPGRNGRDGRQGPKGIAGIPGKAGKNGTDGLPGLNGRDGPPGPPGPAGLPGPNGIPAPSGQNGLPGINGVEGLNGKPGLPGVAGICNSPPVVPVIPSTTGWGWSASVSGTTTSAPTKSSKSLPRSKKITILKGSSWSTPIAFDNETSEDYSDDGKLNSGDFSGSARVDLDFTESKLKL